MSGALTQTLLPLAQSAEGFVREAGSGATTCEGKNDTVCIGYAVDHLGDYVTPTLEHVFLVAVSVVAGLVIALGLAVLSHRRRWLIPTFVGATGVLYTIPSIALFLLLLPITGRGTTTAVIALTLYTLQIIYRNTVTGLANVPESSRDAGRGMGMTDRQVLWKIEMPLAVPEIIAGVRIATVSTVAIATLAVFAGAGGLGDEIYNGGIQRDLFKTGIVLPSVIAIALAIAFDGVLLLAQRALSPVAPSAAGMTLAALTLPLGSALDSFGGAVEFIFNERISEQGGSLRVGGLGQVGELLASQALISALALLIALLIAMPIGVYLGHRGVGEFAAVAVGNAGRAVPELALIGIMVAFVGTGVVNVTIAVMILGIPPILTNCFVGIRQVDRGAVDAARGMGMSELEIIRRVELPLAVPTIMGGVRTGAVNIVATSTIGSLAGVDTLGKLILGDAIYGNEGVIAGAIMVALLALAFEFGLAGLQRLLTPRGISAQHHPSPVSA